MSEYITLLGAEDVRAAGYSMVRAEHTMGQEWWQETAEELEAMQHAVNGLEEALRRHRQWADEWLEKFKAIREPEHDQRSQPEAGRSDGETNTL